MTVCVPTKPRNQQFKSIIIIFDRNPCLQLDGNQTPEVLREEQTSKKIELEVALYVQNKFKDFASCWACMPRFKGLASSRAARQQMKTKKSRGPASARKACSILCQVAF